LDCIFCNYSHETIVAENELAVALLDGYPVSPGHLLVMPKRHFDDFFEATEDEVVAIYRVLRQAREYLTEWHHPDGFNVGVNVGKAAGQSVQHLHLHLIPRYTGDVERPRGGVRNLMLTSAPPRDNAGASCT
jgi:diadenosine tetraphosphate (Ap4A) HIT family hydrolase